MTAVRQPRWMACGKIPYPTRVDALVALSAAARRHAAGHPTKAPARVYRCSFCSRWHLTSQGGA